MPEPAATQREPKANPTPIDAPPEVALARRVLRDEAVALEALARSLDSRFQEAVRLIVACADSGGTVLVSGLGKSGLIGAKISATLASLGIPSHAVHPSEAAHGDLGRFRPTDTVLCLSHSGETDEVVNLAAILRQDGIRIISITGGDARDAERAPSSLEQVSDVWLPIGRVTEAGGPDLSAPTTSTTATLALGDALAIVASRARNYTNADFAKRHPGGTLGGLLRPVVDVLRFRVGANAPCARDDAPLGESLRSAEAVAGRRPGALLLTDAATGCLTGIFTDGDLRRLVLRDPQGLSRPARDVMTRHPRTLPDTARVRDAVTLIREFRQDEIPVVDAAGRPVGLLDVQDLIAMKLVKESS